MLAIARPITLAVVVAFALLVGYGAAPHSPAPVGAVDGIVLQQLTTGLSSPTAIATAGDNRIFVVEQTGRIRIYDPSATPKLLTTPFLDVSGLVSCCTERGLLGLAFHPQYTSNRRFFIFYTELDGDVVVARGMRSVGNPNVAETSVTPILTVNHQAAANHNGGQLQFGPDGHLYVAIGDGGGGGDPEGDAQNINSLLGKILRINVDGATYVSPSSNPFVGVAGADEIWAYGLRNPWRFTFDRLTGEMFIGDVGQELYEEISYQPAGSPGGLNYGWNLCEGNHTYPGGALGCTPPGTTPPIIEYYAGDGSGQCSVTGGYRYRGSAAPSLVGKYIYTDFCSGYIWAATLSGSTWTPAFQVDAPFNISSLGEDNMGELYATDLFGGALYQLTVLDTDGDGLGDAVDNCPNDVNPQQEHADRNFVDLTPPKSNDDLTWINSDLTGDACDLEDDNDSLSDSAEDAGCDGTGPTNSTLRDTDRDRYVDSAECTINTNPNNAGITPSQAQCVTASGAASAATDTDGDSVRDYVEYCFYGSNRTNNNSDGDTCTDGKEVTTFDQNTVVNAADLGLVASGFGMYTAPPAAGTEWKMNMDVDKNGTIGASDLGLVAAKFGACP